MKRQNFALGLCSMVLTAACGSQPPQVRSDGGANVDGGASVDGGVSSDGGPLRDGGATGDGGVRGDGGAADAGACTYTCALDCVCEKDARGCDLERCEPTVRCDDPQQCAMRSVTPDRTCQPVTMAPERGGQIVAHVSTLMDCRERALPCRARLVGERLVVDPFVLVDTRQGIDCVNPPSTVVVQCTTPALPAGTYSVLVAGMDVGRVEVSARLSSAMNCLQPLAPASATTCTRETLANATSICPPVKLRASAPHDLAVRHDCGGCLDLPATCDVYVDLDPRARRIQVTANKRRCDCSVCGACAEVCMPMALHCALPALPRGTYRLELPDGRSTLEVGDDVVLVCE